jgi:hypothetical protein
LTVIHFLLFHHFRVLFELFDETIVGEDTGSPLFDKGDSFFKIHMVLSDQVSNNKAGRTGNSRIAKLSQKENWIVTSGLRSYVHFALHGE